MRLVLAVALVTLLACGDDSQSNTADPAPAISAGEEAPEEDDARPVSEPPSSAPDDGAIVIVPGQSIGPIRMGMSRAAVDALAVLSPHPEYSAMTIPYTAYYDEAGVVHQVEVSLMHAQADIRVGTASIPRTAGMAGAKVLLGDCGPDDIADGGTTSSCRGGGLQVIVGSGSPDEVWLRIPVAD